MSKRRGGDKRRQNARGVPVGGLFPDKPKRPKKNAQVNFRPSDEQASFMDRAQSRGYTRSRVVQTALDLAIGLDAALREGEMEEFAAFAKELGCSLGSVIARAARLGFIELKKQAAADKSKAS